MRRRIYYSALCAALLSCVLTLVEAGQVQTFPPRDQDHLGTESGYGIFQQRCTGCHGNPNAEQHAPAPATLRQLSPEAIYNALATGTMKVQGQRLSDEEKRRVAESLSGRPLGGEQFGDAAKMPNHCTGDLTFRDPSSGPAWDGWGADLSNTRFQPGPAAGITADQVPRLKLKWAFGYPNGVTAAGQPTVVSGRVFVGTDIAYVYSLDAATGCVYWSFQSKASVRNAISIGPIAGRPGKYAAYFGDAKANVYALDAASGELLWTTHVEDHFTARITAAPTLYRDRLYVPVSSFEEFAADAIDYPCCTFRGSVVALDATTGRQLWKTYVIPDAPKPTRKNSAGTQLFAPAGASVWNSPTVDVERHAIYFGTGDAETEPAAKTSDAVMALDMETGKVLWTFQGTENDSYLLGCSEKAKRKTRSENCPKVEGPDWDFGASPILRPLANGRRVLLAAQKSGNVLALDPDRSGALLWKVNVESKLPRPNPVLVWGGAADERNAYFGLSSGGMVAIKLEDGTRQWFTPMVAKGASRIRKGMAAAATVIPGAVFVGGWDGRLHALSTTDGRALWEFSTVRNFPTVNQVPAHGGSFGAPGPTIVGGMLFVGSGYGVFGDDLPGNVLLAFSLP